jgi:hypothetical protein
MNVDKSVEWCAMVFQWKLHASAIVWGVKLEELQIREEG